MNTKVLTALAANHTFDSFNVKILQNSTKINTSMDLFTHVILYYNPNPFLSFRYVSSLGLFAEFSKYVNFHK